MVDVFLWVGFHIFVAAVLAIDLGLLNRNSHVPTFREALGWTGVWVTLALIFNYGVFQLRGADAGQAFLAGYLLELSLSVDNLFVFIVIFSFFKIPKEFQHRVLFWGILGAVVLRGGFILGGLALVKRFDWLLYIFGLLLIYTGVKMVKSEDHDKDPSQSLVLRLMAKVMPMSHELNSDRFTVKIDGRTRATPLLTALIFLDICDVVFAMDSIPAILGVTSDSFVAYTSNIFAILGLRSMYFFIAGVMSMFRFLNYGLAVILSFVGAKLLLHNLFQISTGVSLGVIGAVLAVTIGLSLLLPEKPSAQEEGHG